MAWLLEWARIPYTGSGPIALTLALSKPLARAVLAAGGIGVPEGFVMERAESMLPAVFRAGRKRWMGIRPAVRGVAMNPVDHPHGGGEGKTSGGRHPVTPWGQPTRGYKTRNNKQTDRFIVKRRGHK